jgi:hypothetical protein
LRAAQKSLISRSLHYIQTVKNCCLIYAGKPKAETHSYFLHQGIKLYMISFDLQASNINEFENKCNNFINSVNLLLQLMIEEIKEES